MKFRYGSFQSSTIFRMVYSRTNTLFTKSMLSNKYFHDSMRTLINQSSTTIRCQILAIANNVSNTSNSFLSISGLSLLQLVKTMPIGNLLTLLRLINCGN